MPHSSRICERNLSLGRSVVWLFISVLATLPMPALADQEREKPEPARLAASLATPVRAPESAERDAWLSRGHAGAGSGRSDIRWIATAGLAVVLAVCGALGVVARRYLPKGPMGSMKVIGRVGLTPKHAVFMVQVGRRVLLLGTGPQGAPSVISDLDLDELPLMSTGSLTPIPARRDDA